MAKKLCLRFLASAFVLLLVLGPLCKPLLVMELPNKRLLLLFYQQMKSEKTNKLAIGVEKKVQLYNTTRD